MLGVLRRAVGAFGYEIKPRGAPVRGYADFLAFARTRGIDPKTVFDVGVGNGTPWLYEAFPKAKFALFEALPSFPREFAELPAERFDYHQVALGEKAGTAHIRIPRGSPTGASLKERSSEYEALRAASGEAVEDDYADVELRTLDSFTGYEPPYVIKLDVEGAEVDVLKGATATLRDVQMAMAEISVTPRHEGEATIAELMLFMEQHGFRLFDIPSASQMGVGGELVFLDLAWIRKS